MEYNLKLSEKEFEYLHSFVCRTGRNMELYIDFEEVVYQSSEESLTSGVRYDLIDYLYKVNDKIKFN